MLSSLTLPLAVNYYISKKKMFNMLLNHIISLWAHIVPSTGGRNTALFNCTSRKLHGVNC